MTSIRPLLCALLGALMAPAVSAQATEAPAGEPPPAESSAPTPFNYQLGLAASWRPTYVGSDRMGWGVRPVLSLQWGRFRLTSSQAGLIEGPSDGARAAGASIALADTARWSAGVALRADNGRSSSDDPRLAGLPEVKATVRGRLYGRYTFDGDAQDARAIGLSVSTDLLNRRGGTTASLDLSRRVALAPDLRWTQSVGLGAADGVYLRSRHGVPADLAPSLGLPAFEPGAGLTDLHLGTGLTWRLHERWRLGGNLGLTRLLGPVADSPLTQQRLGYGVVFGLVYISGKD